jgi:hypothetical protein
MANQSFLSPKPAALASAGQAIFLPGGWKGARERYDQLRMLGVIYLPGVDVTEES